MWALHSFCFNQLERRSLPFLHSRKLDSILISFRHGTSNLRKSSMNLLSVTRQDPRNWRITVGVFGDAQSLMDSILARSTSDFKSTVELEEDLAILRETLLENLDDWYSLSVLLPGLVLLFLADIYARKTVASHGHSTLEL
ncbi:hypothetical protein Tco_0025822 [Tanacetum coccineum]